MNAWTKAKGSLIAAFYKEWPMGDDWYYEETDIDDDEGNITLEPDGIYPLEQFGNICWQGPGRKDAISFAGEFNKWLSSKVKHTVFTLDLSSTDSDLTQYVKDELAKAVSLIQRCYPGIGVSLKVSVTAENK